ncbi:hypothetical protein BH11ACT2_BH11ACT2_01130 [soil metagenome]
MNKQTAFITAGVAAAALALGGTTIALASTTSPYTADRSHAQPAVTGTPTSRSTADAETSDAEAPESSTDDPTATPSSTPSSTPTTVPVTRPTKMATKASTLGSAAQLELAKAAALAATGGVRVLSANATGSSNHAYEVRVKLASGTVSEVKLAADFTVLRIEPQGGATHETHDATDDNGKHAGDDKGGDRSGKGGNHHDDNGSDDNGSDGHGSHGHGSDD